MVEVVDILTHLHHNIITMVNCTSTCVAFTTPLAPPLCSAYGMFLSFMKLKRTSRSYHYFTGAKKKSELYASEFAGGFGD
jgi:hypothetical protein